MYCDVRLLIKSSKFSFFFFLLFSFFYYIFFIIIIVVRYVSYPLAVAGGRIGHTKSRRKHNVFESLLKTKKQAKAI